MATRTKNVWGYMDEDGEVDMRDFTESRELADARVGEDERVVPVTVSWEVPDE